MDSIAIIGVGQTKHNGSKNAETYDTMIYEVTMKALEDAGMTISEIHLESKTGGKSGTYRRKK